MPSKSQITWKNQKFEKTNYKVTHRPPWADSVEKIFEKI